MKENDAMSLLKPPRPVIKKNCKNIAKFQEILKNIEKYFFNIRKH